MTFQMHRTSCSIKSSSCHEKPFNHGLSRFCHILFLLLFRMKYMASTSGKMFHRKLSAPLLGRFIPLLWLLAAFFPPFRHLVKHIHNTSSRRIVRTMTTPNTMYTVRLEVEEEVEQVVEIRSEPLRFPTSIVPTKLSPSLLLLTLPNSGSTTSSSLDSDVSLTRPNVSDSGLWLVVSGR